MTSGLNEHKFRASLFSAVFKGMDSLLTTEASRRRARIEVRRAIAEVVARFSAIGNFEAVPVGEPDRMIPAMTAGRT